jgi:hypothetical protein
MLADIAVEDTLLSGKRVYFENFVHPSATDEEKAAARRQLGAIVARHGGTIVASATLAV